MGLITLTGLMLLVAFIVVGWVAWRRVRQEPRRLANAGWVAATLLLGIQVLGARTAWCYWPSAMLREFVAVVRNSPKAYGLGLALVVVPLTLLS